MTKKQRIWTVVVYGALWAAIIGAVWLGVKYKPDKPPLRSDTTQHRLPFRRVDVPHDTTTIPAAPKISLQDSLYNAHTAIYEAGQNYARRAMCALDCGKMDSFEYWKGKFWKAFRELARIGEAIDALNSTKTSVIPKCPCP